MPKEYGLSYLPDFHNDLNETVQYISVSLGNPIAASDLIDKVEKAILKRLECPEAFEPYQSLKERAWPYYRIYVDNYVIYYVVIHESDGTKTMEVRRFLYGGRDRAGLI